MVQLLTYVPDVFCNRLPNNLLWEVGRLETSLWVAEVPFMAICKPFLAYGLALKTQMLMPLLSPCLCLHVSLLHCCPWHDSGGGMGMSDVLWLRQDNKNMSFPRDSSRVVNAAQEKRFI